MRLHIAALAAGLPIAACDRGQEPPPQRPNVMVITLDTLRADALGSYGAKGKVTPNLDTLAAEGARFTRAYTVVPLTIPAHSSLFTGLLPPRHNVRDNGDYVLSDSATTLAELYSGAGYATMAAVGAEVTSRHWGFGQGFDAYFDDMGTSRDLEENRWRVERRADEVVADALGWLEDRGEDDRPWFSWVHMFDPHFPFEAPEPFASMFKGRPYQAEVAWTDAQVGALLQPLADKGLLDETWVFVLADHGEGLGSHGEAMHGVLLYDSTTRIPLIVRPPGGLDAPLTVDAPTSIVDVMPTALAAAGLSIPDGLDGRDLSGLILGVEEPAMDRVVYLESLYAWRHYGWAPQRALVDGTHKLIASTTPEVYHRRDIHERDDLAQEDPDLLTALSTRLHELLEAMPQEQALATPAEVSRERMAQLEALGYVTGGAEGPPEEDGLPDPVSRLPVLRQVEKARQALQEGDLDEAHRSLQAILEEEPGLYTAWNLLLQVAMRRGDLEGALLIMQEMEEHRASSEVRSLMGTVLMQRGQPDIAMGLFQQALELEPFSERAWGLFLQALYLQGDIERLEDELVEAREKISDTATLQGFDGLLLEAKGEWEEAEPLLAAAWARDPTLPYMQLAMGRIHTQRGDTAAAELAFQEEARLFASVAARRMLVEIYAEQRRHQEQIEQLQQIIQAEPPFFMTWHSLAQALFTVERYGEAREAVETCRELAPAYPACAMLHANVLKRLGDDEGAEAAYQQALALAEEALGQPVEGVRPEGRP